ncbi:hypothetical protein M3P05_18590 [Sansalvadorimonas sp. 2012CJ34-2]|uniref:Uncharacterized protein n=1 Tax=Parendozoicomonas callyspongiae TaxID=2942213 RepID=A0ABT0PLS5_9GAMM|nr:hypothetical protein [Sansalvadorimonas sp. 2012CJ34-2]MCL6271931.1 hypothetical protein [Sansalvadorimonas sp. 2012CJ34-2]
MGDYVLDFAALADPMLYSSYDEYVEMMHTDMVKDLKKQASSCPLFRLSC